MRAYITGELSNPQKDTFFLVSFWFANKECEDNMEISENCFRLDGVFTESISDATSFESRWKGVVLCYMNENGEYIETEDFTINQLNQMIQEKNMRIVNADAYYDSNVNVKITSFWLQEDENTNSVFDTDRIDEIEFVILEGGDTNESN